MLVPRIIISVETLKDLKLLKSDHFQRHIGICLSTTFLDRTEALKNAHSLKNLCLQFKISFLTDDVEIAALVNADGVCCAIDDEMHGRAKDVLGDDKIIGGTAHGIQDVAGLYEEGMVDFVILESFVAEGSAQNILGKQKTQTIIDDARIMGYDIPITLAGGIDSSNVNAAMSTGAYGIMSNQPADIDSFVSAISNHPIR